MGINATLRKGTDRTLNVSIPEDRSGYTVVGYRVGKILRDTTVLEITGSANANGSVVTIGAYDGTNTAVSITFARQDSEGLQAMRHVHELWLADGSGNRDEVLKESEDDTAYLTVKETLPASS